MVQRGTLTFSDPGGYARAFGAANVSLTICSGGDFRAQLTWLKLQHLEVYRCTERLARIAFVSFPPDRIFVSFRYGSGGCLVTNGHALAASEVVFHGRGEPAYQVVSKVCQWGLLSVSSEKLANVSKALRGRTLGAPEIGKYLVPARADAKRFRRIFAEACQLAESRRGLVENAEVERAVEQEMLHALVDCLIADEVEGSGKLHAPATVMARFEEAVGNRMGEKPDVSALCADVGIQERTLRSYCAKFLGVGPAKYMMLRRLNRVRLALQNSTPSTSSIAEIARAHQFSELGRFAAIYRSVFDELPSVTLGRGSLRQAG